MRTLRKGDKGEDVKKLQTALNRAGADITVDGSYGSGTEKAVRNFQKARNLTIDGVVGPETWAELNKPTNNQLYNALVTCLDAIEDLPEFKTLSGLLEDD